MHQNLGDSRAKSSAHLSSKKQYNSQNIPEKHTKRQNFIQNLLHKRTLSTKKVFTDETTYTYKPQINELPFQLYPQTRSQVQISKENIYERLVENIRSKEDKLRLEKIKKQDQQFKQKCSFKPQISEASKKIISQKMKTQGPQLRQNLFKRLYDEGLQKILTNQRTCLGDVQKQLTQQHTFQPSINPNSKKIINAQSYSADPIYKRLHEIMQKKREDQKNLQVQKAKQIQNCSNFTVYNKKTLEILKNHKNKNDDVVKRLLEDYFNDKQQKTKQVAKQEKEKHLKQCTFRPKVNSNCLLINSSNFDNDQNFLDRQKQFEEAVKQNIQSKANQMVPTFRPQINRLSQLICKDREFESLDDKLNRLNYQPLFQKQAKLEELQKSVYKQCKFHPEINQISKALTGPLKHHSCKCHPVPENYNFKPTINEKSKQMVQKKASLRLNQQQNQAVKTKSHKINKLKMQRQYKQLIECTFQPKTCQLNKQKLKIKQNVTSIVAGVREFVQRKNEVIRKKLQQQEYNQKVFCPQKRYKAKTFTSVQQFKLSHQNMDRRNEQRLLQEAQIKFQKDCPFRPNIGSMR